MERIVIVGTCGSGKSTLAAALSQRLGSKHIELDALHWEPDWVERSDEVFSALVEQAIAAESWVADGNYSQVRELLWPQATMIIWLNYSFWRVFYQVLKRTLVRSISRQVLYANNVESLRKAFFSRDSIIGWMIKTYHRRRARFQALLTDGQYANAQVRVFTAPDQARRFLAELPSQPALDQAGNSRTR